MTELLDSFPRRVARMRSEAITRLLEQYPREEPCRRPAPGWAAGAALGHLTGGGYAVLTDVGLPTTRSCVVKSVTGNCHYSGVAFSFATTEADARVAARRELVRVRRGSAPAGRRGWIRPVEFSLRGYDLTEVLGEREAEHVRRTLLNGLGDEPAWDLAKTSGCEAILLPSRPASFFCFERCLDKGVSFGAVVDPPVDLPYQRLHTVLDFALENAIRLRHLEQEATNRVEGWRGSS